jgi:hypothetical protein
VGIKKIVTDGHAGGEASIRASRVIGCAHGYLKFESSSSGHSDYQHEFRNRTVADAIAKLVETPAGKRPLRTVCGPDYGAIAINAHTAPIPADVLRALGMDRDGA